MKKGSKAKKGELKKEKKERRTLNKNLVLAVIAIVLIVTAVYLVLNRPETAKQGDIVLVNYVGMMNGNVFDTNVEKVAKEAGIYNPSRNYEPMEVQIGAGNLIKGFEDALYMMKEGETKKVSIPPELGYGKHDPEKVLPFPLEGIEHSEEIAVGTVLTDSQGIGYYVVSVNETHAFVDTNHPFAGKTLDFEIKLVKIK